MFTVEALTEDHDLTDFDSGEPDLDDWLRDHALKASVRDLSRTFVLVELGHERPVGYFTLLAHTIEKNELTKKMGRGLPSQLPAVLLAKLALDRAWHGQGLGGNLLAEVIARAVATSEQVGVRFLVVDALHEEAASFYEHYGFTRVPTSDSLRLVQRISVEMLKD